MTDRRVAALDRLATRLAARAGQSATYRRGGASVVLTVVLTRASSAAEPADYGAAGGLDAHELDAVFGVADLGVLAEPEPGDYLDTTVRGTLRRYKVVRFPGEDAHRFADPLRTLYRVHLHDHGTP